MQLLKVCKRFCSILQNVPKDLVDLKHVNFLKVKTAYLEQLKDQYILSLEFTKSPNETDDAMNITNNVELQIDPELTVKEFVENCQEYLKDNVTLYSIDKVPLAGVNTMEQIIKEPFYLLTNNQHLFFVKQLSGYDKDDYSYIKSYFTRKHVPMLEKNILIQYLVRMDYVLQQNFKTTFFKNYSSSQQKIEYNDLVKVILDSYTNMRNTQSDHEADMYTQYFELKKAKELLEEKRKELMDAAIRFAKIQMFGGFLVLCGHFCFMGAGIYVYYNWDVMEPIGYFLNTGGMIYLSYQYFKLNDEWSHSKFSNYLINKNFVRLSRSNNFDIEKLDQINKQIQEIQDRIKTNIITNL
ncbi:unnamed protein product [Paramecium sonneborni]|uniref:Calcium uniporter protein C-terminal domain-containing protein n=1 Tax=Paramecium sonneborni TaxID=65129 RepID=A0A8S1Q4P7_9CILI|nr:unnamed protein product [Paramecium sonneborni]